MEDVAKRRHIRALPDMEDFAFIDFNTDHDYQSFEPIASAYIVNEAPLGGCSLVLRKSDKIIDGTGILVKVGKILPLHAKVVWLKELDEDLVRVGVQFLE